jgi:hypothetical protein
MKISKHIKQLKRREALKLNHHIESLGAAFCRETGLKPQDTALITTSDDKGTYYYFTAKPEPLDIDGLPPQLRELLDMNIALDNAVKADDHEGVEVSLGIIAAYLERLK